MPGRQAARGTGGARATNRSSSDANGKLSLAGFVYPGTKPLE